MDPMLRMFPAVLAIVTVLASGVVHGLWTDRWGMAEEPMAAAARLDQLPLDLGDWQGQPLDFEPSQLGPVAGYLYRRYVNQRNGASVSVSLLCGRPGPVAIHTPDVCYVASGYQAAPAREYSPSLDPS